MVVQKVLAEDAVENIPSRFGDTVDVHDSIVVVLDTKKDSKLQILEDACNDDKCFCILNGVFKHDSSWATAGVGKKTNNPGNMRPPTAWKPSVPFTIYHSPGNGKFARFNSLEDGIKANVELYYRHYAKHKTASALVATWTSGDGGASYRSAVKNCF